MISTPVAVMGLVVAVVVPSGCDSRSERAVPATTAPSVDIEVEPLVRLWNLESPAGIEWVRPFGEPVSAIIVCDRLGAIDVVDPTSGSASRLDATFPTARPATQLTRQGGATSRPSSQPAGDLFYCFDSFTLAAVNVAEAKMSWRVGVWPDPDRQAGTDPEFLDRLLAVHAVEGGPLAVRSDGTVGVLSAKDGSPKWTHHLPRMTQCRIHVRGSVAAIVAKSGPKCEVHLFDLRDEPPKPRTVAVGEVMPFWSGLSDDRIALVWPDRIALLALDGESRANVRQPEARFAKAAIRLLRRPGASDLLILADLRGGVRAYSTAAGELRWTAAPMRAGTAPSTSEITRTQIVANAEIVAAASGVSYSLLDARSGRPMREPSTGIRALSGGLRAAGRTFYVLGRPDGAASDGRIELWRDDTQRAAGLDNPTRFGVAHHRAREVGRVLFVGDRLVIVEQNRASAYTLP